MDINQIRHAFTPAVQEIIDICRVTDDFVDKDMFRVYVATIWGNAVLEPKKTGITEADLEPLHDFLGEEIEKILGGEENVTSCFEYIMSKSGQDSLNRLQISQRHREFLTYFAQLILQRDFSEDI
jgi:hypothetical protein